MDITIFCSQFQLSLHLVPSILCQSPAWRGYSRQKENIDDALHSPVPKILQQCGWQRKLGPRVHPQLGNFWPLPFATFHHCPECQPSRQSPLREPQPCKALNLSTSTANPLTSHHTLWNGTMPHLWQAPWHLLVSVNPLDLLKVFTPSLLSGHCAASLKDEIKSSGQCLAVTFWWVFCSTSPRPAPSEWTALLACYPAPLSLTDPLVITNGRSLLQSPQRTSASLGVTYALPGLSLDPSLHVPQLHPTSVNQSWECALDLFSPWHPQLHRPSPLTVAAHPSIPLLSSLSSYSLISRTQALGSLLALSLSFPAYPGRHLSIL